MSSFFSYFASCHNCGCLINKTLEHNFQGRIRCFECKKKIESGKMPEDFVTRPQGVSLY